MRKNAQIFWYQKKGSLWVTYQSWLKLLIVNKQHINQSMDLGEKHLDHLAGDRIKGQTVTKDMELNGLSLDMRFIIGYCSVFWCM
jgi:hypothetical protein